MNRRMNRTMRAVLLLVLPMSGMISAVQAAPAKGAAAAPSQRVVCWTDERGQRACGDRVPPQYAKQERQIFDAQGRVVQTKAREKTADEVAAEEEAIRRAEALKVDEQKARERDRFLLTTYESSKDIQRARDERVQILEGRKLLVEKNIIDNEKAIQQQKARLANLEKSGKKVTPVQAKKLAELQKTLESNRRSLDSTQADLEETKAKYDADIERYETLKAARR